MPDPVDPLGCPRPAGKLPSPDGCDRAIPVVICDAPLITPLTIVGADCAGAPVTVVGAKGALVQTVPHPDAVQKVQLCNASGFDREKQLLCDPATGAGVWVVTLWPSDAVPGTLPTVEAYTQSGAAYTGAISALTRCNSEKLDIGEAEFFCANGQTLTRTTAWDVSGAAPVAVSSVWQDLSGAVVAAPAAATLASGACAIERQVKIYLERNGGVISMADIVAAVGTSRVQAVTVKQISGRGTVSADSGSGVPIDAGEVWSWSAISGAEALDLIGDSQLAFDAGTGEQRISATYLA